MARPARSTGEPKHLERNPNKLDISVSKKNSTSPSQNQTTLPSYRNFTKNNEVIVFSSIQWKEDKNKILKYGFIEDSSSIVESSSLSDEEFNAELNLPTLEPTIKSRKASIQKRNMSATAHLQPISFFEKMPLDLIKRILFDDIIDLNNLPSTAKKLMVFAAIGKFYRECVRELLTEEGLQEISFQITKSVIPDLLAALAIDKKVKFTQADIDRLVHDWPYLTVDCSYKKYICTNRGDKVLKEIVHHLELQGIRIINNLPGKITNWNEKTIICNTKGPELIYELLSRKTSHPLKIDFIFNNWEPSLFSKTQLNDKSYDLIKKIQDRADKCGSVTFGEINLSRNDVPSSNVFGLHHDSSSNRNRKYQLNFVKMMCNIALVHSAHSISLAGLNFLDEEIGLILNEIMQCDKPSLQYLDLSENQINEHGLKSLRAWLQSGSTCIKTLHLNNTNTPNDELTILYDAIKNNHSLELLEINTMTNLPDDHPIREDKRVKINGFLHWI